MLFVYVDGATSKKKGGNFRSASAIISDCSNFRIEESYFFDNKTISFAELKAMEIAIKKSVNYAKQFDEDVLIISDSEYAVKSMNNWIYSWSKNNWLKSNGEEVQYKDIMIDLYENYLKKDIKYKKLKIVNIKGHITHGTIDKYRRKFNYDNDMDLTNDEFKSLVIGNHSADALAVNTKENAFGKYCINIKGGNNGKKEKILKEVWN